MTQQINQYAEALAYLYDLRWFGAKLGLENVRALTGRMGNPGRHLRFLHVAGTNGKGSTCAMLESIYRTAGYRTGLFTSPHLVSFRERLQVDRTWISRDDVIRLVNQLRPFLEQFPQENHPTFFEALTVMALVYFTEQHCDVVIWETGLGGRLDATNMVTPLASIITNVQFDHQKWLGNTLREIAAEKAGIIKPGVPVITGETGDEPLQVIVDTAQACGSAVHKAEPFEAMFPSLEKVPLPLSGAHQRRNAATAIATIETLQGILPVPESSIRTGLGTVHWPGRMQSFTAANGQRFLLDGAHNIAGAEALAGALRREASQQRTLILGILLDKDYSAICHALSPLAQRILLVPVQNERTAMPAQLVEACVQSNPSAEVIACSTLAEAIRLAATPQTVVITGSLYLVGEAIQLLGLAPPDAGDERHLNEWAGRR